MNIKAKKKVSAALVSGTTVVDHKIRAILGITLEEYVVADAISRTSDPITYAEYFSSYGLKPNEVNASVRELLKAGIIAIVDNQPVLTELWDKHFGNDLETEFTELWAMVIKDGRHGQRNPAKEKYVRCRKIASKAEIFDGYKRYLNFITKTGTYQKNLSTWLNPANKLWEEEYSFAAPTTAPGEAPESPTVFNLNYNY